MSEIESIDIKRIYGKERLYSLIYMIDSIYGDRLSEMEPITLIEDEDEESLQSELAMRLGILMSYYNKDKHSIINDYWDISTARDFINWMNRLDGHVYDDDEIIQRYPTIGPLLSRSLDVNVDLLYAYQHSCHVM